MRRPRLRPGAPFVRGLLAVPFAALALLAAGQGPGDRPAPNPVATRSVVYARNGIIATSQPLASAAGLRVLQAGGNAVDAAVTAAAVLAVVEPTQNGVGGDLFALVYDARAGAVHGLNASGRSPAAATVDEFRRRKLDAIPLRGALSVSVPGAVDGWHELLARFGTIAMGAAVAPAAGYARDGFPVGEIVATEWQNGVPVVTPYPESAAIFLPGGKPPAPGEVFRNPDLAATLETIGREGRDALYRGGVGREIAAAVQRHGGLLTEEDLAAHRSSWVEPISTTYRGYTVLELPPSTQGVVALQMLNILEGFDLKTLGHNSAPYLHLLVEAKRIAFADRDAWLGDADAVDPARLARMLSKEYAAERRGEIQPDRAAAAYAPMATGAASGGSAPHVRGDTVYLTAADRWGNVVSLIQSNYLTFGSGIVGGRTGILLHNRGSLFTFADGHANRLAPAKRPFHTLIPAMVLQDGRPWLSYGVMGGDMQPQGHVQVLLNLLEFGMNIQEAGEAARFRHSAAGLALESAIPAAARFGLAARGHDTVSEVGTFGGFQGILFDRARGVMMGGSDPRKDGLAIGY